MTIRERIRRHHRTLTALRRKSEERNGGGAKRIHKEAVTPPEGHTHFQMEVQEGDDVIRTGEEEEEEESEVLLPLSESSPSSTGSDVGINPEEAEPERKQEVTSTASTTENDDEEAPHRTEDEEAFAEDYLLRMCDAVQVCPGILEQLLQVLDRCSSSSSSSSSSAERLFGALSRVLRPWPQLLRDFAAFLNRRQARHCGLLTEQRLFERSRRFLRRLGRSLGEDTSLFQQVVSVLQGSPAPPAENLVKVSSLLILHSDLHKEFWDFFQQLHDSETDFTTQNASLCARIRQQAAEGAESEPPVGARNISMTSTGEKVVVWTREADRSILTACQQRGANRKTFRQVSAHLGNKTAQQVSLRFSDLMKLFHKSTSCSSEGRPIGSQEAALD
ncbi:GON-4-like protein [Pseudoliparis swirei]|uniref:GON-4-like protein n=1 Tax=Pseudoliparis swirei TaxID=2059687 RepID=UPI0024BD8885|nr:GON-4-like protein [Pseudoliparis swirei]